MLETGMYAPSNKKKVYVWPLPDANGDGDEVWEDRVVGGVSVGRDRKKDNNGNVVRRYNAPEGFRNFPSFDGTENYVLTQENGQPLRMPDGTTVPIKEGSATVVYADGRVETLEGEYAMYVFAQAHEKVGDAEETPAEKIGREQESETSRNSEIDALRARLRELEGPDNLRGTQTSEPVRSKAKENPTDTNTAETKQEETSAQEAEKSPEKSETKETPKPTPPAKTSTAQRSGR